jgi:hypothetical protein
MKLPLSILRFRIMSLLYSHTRKTSDQFIFYEGLGILVMASVMT